MENENGTQENPLRTQTFNDAIREGRKIQAEIDSHFEYDGERITIKIAYPYHIEMSRIKNHASLLNWIHHLIEKPWMDTDHLGRFIEMVCKIKGWNIHADY